MADSYATQLTRVQAAIENILNGAQEHTVSSNGGSRSIKNADLETLFRQEARLLKLVRRENKGGIIVRGGTPSEVR